MEEWPTVRFGDVVQKMNGKIDLEQRAGKLCVRGEHIPREFPPAVEHIVVDNDYLGPAFHRTFEEGDVLFATRFPNLNKVGHPRFKGICANTTLVLRTSSQNLIQDIIPMIMKTNSFVDYCILNTRGSTNPYINWTQLAEYQFSLPPIAVQQKILEISINFFEQFEAKASVIDTCKWIYERKLGALVNSQIENSKMASIKSIINPEKPLCYGVVQPGKKVPSGTKLLRVCDLENDIIDKHEMRTISLEIDAKFGRSKVAVGDLVVSVVGTIGRVHVITEDLAGVNIARAVARVSCNTEVILPDYLKLILSSNHYQFLLNNYALESARKTLNLKDLGEIEIPYPDLSEQQSAIEKFGLLDQILDNAKTTQSSTLNLLRSISMHYFDNQSTGVAS